LDNQTGPDLKSHFICILPALAKEALSLEEMTNMDSFTQLVLALVTPAAGRLKASPWGKSQLSRKLTEQLLVATLSQLTAMEWNVCDDDHLRFSICIRMIEILLQLDKYFWGQDTDKYFWELDKTIWFLLKWYMILSSNQSEIELQLRGVIEECFNNLGGLYSLKGKRIRNFQHFISGLSSKRILALPSWIMETKFFRALATKDLDDLFSHFFRIVASHANPEFPSTEEDRMHTLGAIIEVVSYQRHRDYETNLVCEQLLASWRNRLVNGTIGAGHAELSEEAGSGITRSEVKVVSAPANRISPQTNQEEDLTSDPPTTPIGRYYDVSDLLDSIDHALHRAEPEISPTSSAIGLRRNPSPVESDRSSASVPGVDRISREDSTPRPVIGSQVEGPTLILEAPLGDNHLWLAHHLKV
jgi:hypothetical protein